MPAIAFFKSFISSPFSVLIESGDQFVQTNEFHVQIPKIPFVRAIHVPADDEIRPFRIKPAESLEPLRIELIGGPFAFDGERRPARFLPDEIDFVPLFIAPIAKSPFLKPSLDFIEHVMFPKQAAILGPQVPPAFVKANKTGVETIDFRRGQDFRAAMRVERPDDMDDKRGLKDGEVIADCRPARLTGPRKFRRFEDSSALREQKLGEPLEGKSPFQPEQFLDVFGPIGVHPFLKLPFRVLLGEEKRRQPASVQTPGEVRVSEIARIFGDHRRQPDFHFAPGQRVPEFF